MARHLVNTTIELLRRRVVRIPPPESAATGIAAVENATTAKAAEKEAGKEAPEKQKSQVEAAEAQLTNVETDKVVAAKFAEEVEASKKEKSKHPCMVHLLCLNDQMILASLDLLKHAEVWFADEIADELAADHNMARCDDDKTNAVVVAYSVPLTRNAVESYLMLASSTDTAGCSDLSPSATLEDPSALSFGMADHRDRSLYLDEKDAEAAELVAAAAVLCASENLSTNPVVQFAITNLARLAIARYQELPSQQEQSEVRFTRSVVGTWLNMTGQLPRELGLLKLFAKYTVLRTHVWIRERLAEQVLGSEQVVFLSGSNAQLDAPAQLCVASAVTLDDALCVLHEAHTVATLRATSATHWLFNADHTNKDNVNDQQQCSRESNDQYEDDEDAWGIIDPLGFLYKGGALRGVEDVGAPPLCAPTATITTTTTTTNSSSAKAPAGAPNPQKKLAFAIRRGEQIPFSNVLAEGSHASLCGRYVAVSFVNEYNGGKRAEMCQLYKWPGTADPIATLVVCPGGLAQARFTSPCSSLTLEKQPMQQQKQQQQQQQHQGSNTCETHAEFLVVGKQGTVALYVLRLGQVAADQTMEFSLPLTHINKDAGVPTTLRAATTATTKSSSLVVAVSTTGTLYVWNRYCRSALQEDAFLGSSAAPQPSVFATKNLNGSSWVPACIRTCDVAITDACAAKEEEEEEPDAEFSKAVCVLVLGLHQVKAPSNSSRRSCSRSRSRSSSSGSGTSSGTSSGNSSGSGSSSFLAMCWYTARLSTTSVANSNDVCRFECSSWIYADVLNPQDIDSGGGVAASATCWAFTADAVATGDNQARVTLWCKNTGARVLQSRAGLIGSEAVTNIAFGANTVAVAAGSFVYVLNEALDCVYRRIVTPGAKPFAWVCPTLLN
jgi:uncharacterized membrane protein YgcG